MAVAQVHFFSAALSKEVAFNVVLPDRQSQGGPYPVLYLLHGLSDDYTAWLRWTKIELYVRELPLMVVMPDGDRSFYCDATEGPAYEKAIVEDLLSFVDRHFHTIPNGRGRAIGGLSMGGYGAMKIGLKYPHLFRSVAAHSGCYALLREPVRDDLGPELQRIYGTETARRENDPFWLAEQLDPGQAPAIRFDCGTDDFLIDHNRAFHEHLTELGIEHEYEEFPGGHEWAYWDEHVREAVAFHCRAFGMATES